jgi:hypothetical protein
VAFCEIWKYRGSRTADGPVANPLQLWTAIQMALLFQPVLFGVRWAQDVGAIGNICFRGVLRFGDMDVLVISMAKNGRHSGAGPNCSSGHCFRCLDEYGFEVGCRSSCGSEEFPQDCRYWSGGDRTGVDDILVDIGLGRLPYASISSDMNRCIFSSVCDCRDCRFARRHGCFQVRIIGQRRARAPW